MSEEIKNSEEKVKVDESPHLKYIKLHNGSVWRIIWKEGYLHFEKIIETYDPDEDFAEKLIRSLK